MNDGRWRKSSYSGTDTKEGECVEVAVAHNAVGCRDTKCRDAGELNVTPAAWNAFLTKVAARD
jgi:hypothetical protein